MNRVICIKGHFYDGDKYEICPHCEAGVDAIRQDSFSVRHSEPEEKSRRRLFRRRIKEQREEYTPETIDLEKTLLLQNNVEPESGMSLQNPETEILFPPSPGVEIPRQKAEQESGSQSSSAVFAASAGIANTECDSEKADEGKTVGFFSASKTEPPVGYLICTAGKDYGMGFALKTGNNSIGRSAFMDVSVTDPKVSREKQAFVMYEPFRREFYVRPGEGAGLCYLNEELVLEPVKMKAFDRILLGDTKLMLIPVCSEKFSWDESV